MDANASSSAPASTAAALADTERCNDKSAPGERSTSIVAGFAPANIDLVQQWRDRALGSYFFADFCRICPNLLAPGVVGLVFVGLASAGFGLGPRANEA